MRKIDLPLPDERVRRTWEAGPLPRMTIVDVLCGRSLAVTTTKAVADTSLCRSAAQDRDAQRWLTWLGMTWFAGLLACAALPVPAGWMTVGDSSGRSAPTFQPLM